jgi:hypothetical protein
VVDCAYGRQKEDEKEAPQVENSETPDTAYES